MMDMALKAVSALALFEALRLIVSSGDLLRLRAMVRLSFALALHCVAAGLAPVTVSILAASACGLRPDLRAWPTQALLLLMLSPAAGFCLVHAALWGWPLPAGLQAEWMPLAALGALIFAFPILPVFGFGWRFRFSALAICTACALAAFGLDADGMLVAMPSYLGALILAFRPSDTRALVRLGAGGAGVFGAPLLMFAAHAGPWTQKPGDELLIVRTPLQPSADGAYGVQTYSESGLSEGLTMVATGFQETSRRATRAGGSLGLRAELWRDEAWIVSAEAAAGIEPFSLNSGTSDWERHAQAELSLLHGWSGDLDGAPVYVSADIDWRIRPQAFGDAVGFSVSAGIDLAPDLQANAHLAAEFGPDRDQTFGQASLLWRIDETVALEAGVQSFTDRDGDLGAQAFAGLWLRF